MSREEVYAGREQTLVKHLILQHYLERFAHIVGSHWESITYVDCFAGPWNARSDAFEDSSFSIALRELRKARDTHAAKGRKLRLRCFFLEKDREAFRRLKAFADQVQDAKVRVLNSTFEDSVGDIQQFVREGGPDNFSFLFIDPTGWTGFALRTIAPLLRLTPCEVLINFMTSHITRFLTGEETSHSFDALFGSPDFRDRVTGLSGLDREDAAVLEYSRNLRQLGGFPHVRRAIVLHREIDRTNFHLVYATRHLKGVEVFKESERLAMVEMERLRGQAQERRRETRTRTRSLFSDQESPESAHYGELRERYGARARRNVLQLLESKRILPYEEAWMAALAEPLVWESDLKDWIREWCDSGILVIAGLGEGKRVPKRGAKHELIWRGDAGS